MIALRDKIREDQIANGVHEMPFCQGLGFLDRKPPQYTVVPARRAAA